MAAVASELIYLTMGKVADYLFGAGKPQHAKQLLARLFRARSNLFSHQFAEVALLSGNVAGLLISYSVRFSNSLELPTAWQLLRADGVPGFIGFLTRAYPLIRIKEAEADEFFIAHVAVLPAHQGHGLGASLLSHAEERAKDQGFNRISLTVEVENERAVSLYRRTGFEFVETVKVEELQKCIGYGGFHRMRKVLT